MKIILIEIIIFIALYTDLKFNKIPNILTFGGMLFGILLNFNQGLYDSLFGFTLVLIAYIPVYVMGAVAAGDVKMLMAIGVTMGFKLTLATIVFTIIFNLLITSVILIKNKKIKRVAVHTIEEIKYRLLVFISPKKDNLLERPNIEAKTMIPYMPAIALGLNIALFIV